MERHEKQQQPQEFNVLEQKATVNNNFRANTLTHTHKHKHAFAHAQKWKQARKQERKYENT